MISFTGVVEGAIAVQDFLYDREVAIPDDLRTKLRHLTRPGVSPVDTIVETAERIYAYDGELPQELLELAAALAVLAEQYNFHGLGTDARGSKMATAMLRKTGRKNTDPKPNSRYVEVELPTLNVVPSAVPTPIEEGAE